MRRHLWAIEVRGDLTALTYRTRREARTVRRQFKQPRTVKILRMEAV